MRSKLISIICITAMLIFAVFPNITVSGEPVGTITSFYITSSGTVEVTGYYDDTDWTETTILLVRGTAWTGNITAEDIMYIDQKPMGNNNTFYYRFKVDERFSSAPCVLAINGGELITAVSSIPDIQDLDAGDISNNALRVGNDFYDIGHSQYTPDNIAGSIERGGNIIYYQIGNMWFDVLDEAATGVEFLVSKNAVSAEDVSQWVVEEYYHY